MGNRRTISFAGLSTRGSFKCSMHSGIVQLDQGLPPYARGSLRNKAVDTIVVVCPFIVLSLVKAKIILPALAEVCAFYRWSLSSVLTWLYFPPYFHLAGIE